ncbi:MAG: VWA domain-containing protein [Verrucomicrobiaceae bacterium]|nr:MAG: VWA domain-containing protein [Verrucomicrobiaceae bacterium]
MSAPALLGELSSLAAQVIGEEVSVVSGKPGCMWSWNWKDREITVCPEDLGARSADVCRAVLMHECAHAAITRIYDLLDRDRQDLFRDLLNILEDIRIEAWLAERFPGCAPWLALANRVFGHEARKAPWPAGQQLQFLKGLLEERWFGDISTGAAREVIEALAETRDAVAEMARCIPPPAPGRAAAREILHSQQAMLAIFLEKIVPVWERLVRADLSAGLPRHTSCDVPFLVAAGQGSGGRRVHRRENTAECARDYLSRQRALAGLIDPLADEMIHLFQLDGRSREVRGHPSGGRLDLRAVMQFEADPRLYDKIWIRQKHPQRFDPAIFLLLDTSSSMKGEKFEGAFDGIVLLSEVCLRAGLPLSVWKFSEGSEHVMPFAASGDQWRRSRLDGLRRHLGSRTDMSSCLKSVRTSPEIALHSHPVVIVLSDGEPDNEQSARAEVQKLKAGGIPCVGIGIGPETHNLRRLFQHSLTGISAKEAAPRVAKILRAAVVQHALAA